MGYGNVAPAPVMSASAQVENAAAASAGARMRLISMGKTLLILGCSELSQGNIRRGCDTPVTVPAGATFAQADAIHRRLRCGLLVDREDRRDRHVNGRTILTIPTGRRRCHGAWN